MKKYILMFLASCPLVAGTLTGKLTLSGGGAVADGSVSAVDATFHCFVNGSQTDGSGNYMISDLDDGSYYLLFSGPGVLSRYHGNTTFSDLASATVVSVSGNTVVNLTGTPEGKITGSVTINGASLNGVTVAAYDPFSVTPVVAESATPGGDGSYTLTGLQSGCYLVGLIYDPEELSQQFPLAFYGGGLKPDGAMQVLVTSGQTSTDIDIVLNLSDLGTLQVGLTAPELADDADITLFDEDNNLYGSDVSPEVDVNVLLPPGTYRAYVDYPNTYMDAFLAGTYTIVAGQTVSANATGDRAGRISGTLQFDETTQTGLNVEVQVLQKSSGAIVTRAPYTLSDPFGDETYIISGLPDGDFAVRVVPVFSVFSFLLPPVRRVYFPEVTSLGAAGTVTISGGSIQPFVDFELYAGSSISGALKYNGQEFGASAFLLQAIEVNTNEVYQADSFTLQGQAAITGMQPGTYKVGVSTGFTVDNSLSGYILSFGGLVCNNMAPSYHTDADNYNDATTVEVTNLNSPTDVDVEVRSGGRITGLLRGRDCSCPLQSNLVGAFQNGKLVKLATAFGGSFEIGGLTDGAYTLRAVVPTLRGQPLPDFDPTTASGFTAEDYFDFFLGFTYGQSVTVSSGAITSIGSWCLPIDPLGSEGTGGVEETKLLYPWISNRANQFESILVANNTGDVPVTVSLTARRKDTGDPAIVYTQTVEDVVIPAKGFLKEFASSLFSSMGDGAGYSVVLTAPSDKIRGRWVTNNLTSPTMRSPSQGVAVRIDEGVTQRVGQELLFGYLPLTNSFTSAPVLVNTGDGPTTVTLKFYDTEGEKVGEEELTDIPVYEPIASLANTFVATATDVFMTVESDREPITGVAFVFNDQGETAIGNATRIDPDGADSGDKTLLYPWVSNRDQQFESVVVVNNLSSDEINVTLTARRGGADSGQSQEIQKTIKPGGFLKEQASSLFDTLGSGSGYSVEVNAPTSKVEGQWVTNNLAAESMASPSQGIAIDISPGATNTQRSGSSVLFGFLPVTNDFTSVPVIVNAGSSNADINLTYYDAMGTVVATDTLSGTTPLLPFVTVANNPEGTGDLYMVASSASSLVTGVVFVFNNVGETAIGNVTRIDNP